MFGSSDAFLYRTSHIAHGNVPRLRALVHLLIMITIAHAHTPHSHTHTHMLLSWSFAGSIFGKPETHGSNHVLVETEVGADHANWAAPLPSGSTCWSNRHVHTNIYRLYIYTIHIYNWHLSSADEQQLQHAVYRDCSLQLDWSNSVKNQTRSLVSKESTEKNNRYI